MAHRKEIVSVEDIIRDTVIESILSFAKKKIHHKANFQILDLIIPKERKIRSIVGGLETSLGTTLWEPLAKRLAASNGFAIINENLQYPSNMPADLKNTLDNIIADRKRKSTRFDAAKSHDALKEVCQTFIDRPIHSFEPAPRGFGVDIWLVKDNVNYFFDTKTVQPNVGSYSKFMEQVLNWYAFYYSRFPKGQAAARIVFPYNPHDGDFWQNTMGKGHPLERDAEGWVENQFWDFCSGMKNTYQSIKSVFREIRSSKILETELNSLFE